MSDFVRESRYIVIKKSDLTPSQKLQLDGLIGWPGHSIRTIEAVVVEKDWPEYEPTWKAIEDRIAKAEGV